MGRRIKEDPQIHRNRMATAAGELFEKKGISQTSMDEVAARAGYSKATLYAYFNSKEEIVAYLVLGSMKSLKEQIIQAVEGSSDPRTQFLNIGNAMASYEQEHPFYFRLLLENIHVELENKKVSEAEQESFQVGDEINEYLVNYFLTGMKQGKFKVQTNIKAVIYSIWGMMLGLVTLSSTKEQYIDEKMHLSKRDFLNKGFQVLYGAIEK